MDVSAAISAVSSASTSNVAAILVLRKSLELQSSLGASMVAELAPAAGSAGDALTVSSEALDRLMAEMSAGTSQG